MSLIDKILDSIPDSVALRIFYVGDKEEKLLSLFKKANKMLAKINHKDWKEYDILKSQINVILNGYHSGYIDYFKKRLKSLEEEEKVSLGYGIHSIL